MFVLQSTHEELELQYLRLKLEHNQLISHWNDLVRKVNALGGNEFLDRANTQFTNAEIRTMIKMCHPDKHGGDKRATEITRKLLNMKGK